MGRIIRLGLRPVKRRSRVSNESICGPFGETFSFDIAYAVSRATIPLGKSVREIQRRWRR
jgi:hypothetical protein